MKRILLMTAIAAIGFAGCSKEESAPVGGGDSRVRIDPTIVTRATEVDFEQGDQIGLSIVASDEELSSQNNCLTYNGTGNVFVSDLQWFTDEGVTADLAAYYPYAAGGVPSTFSVKTDQSAAADYSASDLMTASKTGVVPTGEAIGMTFYHRLTKLLISVDNTMASPVSKVIVENLYGTGDVDVAAGSVSPSADEGKTPVTANAVEAGRTYRAIVIPQAAAITVTVELADGTVLSQEQAVAELKAGGQYPVSVTVSDGTLRVSLSGEIQNWTNEEPIQPQTDPVPFEEGADSFSYAGETYGFKTLADGKTWMTENMRYVPAGMTPSDDPTVQNGIWYPYTSDGTTQTAVKDAEGIRAKGYLYDYRTAFGVAAIDDANCAMYEGIQGICPKGWHIPTLKELIGLFGKCTKLADGSDLTDTSAAYYDSGYDGGKVPTLNEAGFNYPLSGVRMCAGIGRTGSYQRGNAAGVLNLSYMMSSTIYKPIYNSTGELTNIQFFAAMTTFTNTFLDGRVTCGYAPYLSGVSVRCVRDTAK